MTSSLKPVLEALLFATNHPLALEAAAEALKRPIEEVERALRSLAQEYDGGERGIRLMELAGGWQIVTRGEFSPFVERMLVGRRRARLTRAGLETLSAVAYQQPTTKGEIDTIRGVDCSGALRTLLDRDLVAVKGRSDKVGRPLLYVTTDAFLEYFGLRSLEDLPRLEDFAALVDRDSLQEQVEASAREEMEVSGEESPQESPRDVPEEPPQEVPEEAPQGSPQEVSQTTPQETSQGTPQETPRESPQESPQDIEPRISPDDREAHEASEMELRLIEDDSAEQGWEEK